MAEEQDEIQRLRQALHDAERRQDEFLAALSHELRNPLSALSASVHVLRQPGVPETNRARAMDIMQRQLFQLSRLVDELLEMSRIARRQVDLNRQTLDLVSLVLSTVQEHRSEMEARGVGLDLVASEAPVWVDGDPTRLAQVIANLLRNALHASSRGTRIAVSVREAEGEAEVTVRDEGAGLEKATVSGVFEPFWRADGLSLVRGLVELHGGRVTVESAGAGKGSALGLRLPLAATPGAPAGDQGLSVLIIEDNPDAAEALEMLLGMAGHRPELAADAQTGLDKARRLQPQVILCDIRLPGDVDGYEIARTLRAEGTRSYLVALTGYGQEHDRQRSREAGFDLHLTKPVQPDELFRLLQRR